MRSDNTNTQTSPNSFSDCGDRPPAVKRRGKLDRGHCGIRFARSINRIKLMRACPELCNTNSCPLPLLRFIPGKSRRGIARPSHALPLTCGGVTTVNKRLDPSLLFRPAISALSRSPNLARPIDGEQLENLGDPRIRSILAVVVRNVLNGAKRLNLLQCISSDQAMSLHDRCFHSKRICLDALEPHFCRQD